MSKKEDYLFLPVSINIKGKKLLIIGGGKVGYHKGVLLNRFTDDVTVISTAFHEGFERLPFKRVKKEYESSDLEGAWLVYICTENAALNAKVKQDAERMHILSSVCDAPSLCDFISPAIYKSGDLTVAVSSNATDVRLSIRMRDSIAKAIESGEVAPSSPESGEATINNKGK